MFDYPEPIPPYHDWIEELRLKRIAEGEAKYGPWTEGNFADRDPLEETILELVDALSYVRMSFMKGRMPRYQWVSLDEQIRAMMRQLKFLQTTNS